MNALVYRYKIPLLIALVTSLGIIALDNIANGFDAIYIVLGSLIGIFILDFEYVLDAYLIDPDSENSKMLKENTKSGKLFGFLKFLNQNETNYEKLPIRSVLFQLLLIIFAYYIMFTDVYNFAKALILTMTGVMIYLQITELSVVGNLERWFWVYNGKVGKSGAWVYIAILVALFCLLFLFI